MRELGTLGMSVGTSLAFEGTISKEINSTDTVLINLRTLIRNASQSYTESPNLNVDQITSDVKQDLVKISQWIDTNRGVRPITIKVYAPTYKSLRFKFKKADLWEPKKEKQIAYQKFEFKVMEALIKAYPTLIKSIDYTLPTFEGLGVIITHHLVDLALSPSPTRLYLLESHTGHLKPYTKWYTKLTSGDKLFNMPVNPLTIQIFGDNSTNFRSGKQAIKELVKNLATERSWSPATSYDKVKTDISSMRAGVDKAGLQMLIN